MILVELFFQELNQRYDVDLDISLPIGGLIENLVELIAQKEHLTLSKTPGTFLLCEPESGRILHPQTTLAENGIQAGMRLLLL